MSSNSRITRAKLFAASSAAAVVGEAYIGSTPQPCQRHSARKIVFLRKFLRAFPGLSEKGGRLSIRSRVGAKRCNIPASKGQGVAVRYVNKSGMERRDPLTDAKISKLRRYNLKPEYNIRLYFLL